MIYKHGFFLLVLSVLLASCRTNRPTSTTRPTQTPNPTPTMNPTPTPTPPTFRIIGYVPDWNANPVQYDKLTHINYAFLLPNFDGTINEVANPWKLDMVVANAHAANVKVLISVGGWGLDPQFEALANDPTTRLTFVRAMVSYVALHQLDGVDIDWEYPDPEPPSQENFVILMRELRQALPADKLLTAAVVALGAHGEGVASEVFDIVDFLNLMAYDGSSTDHSPYSYAEAAIDYWSGRGLPAEKMVLGVPFYSRPGEIPYRKLIAQDPAAAYSDTLEANGSLQYYNGIPTIQRKTELAMQRASGIMFWEISQDTNDETSLLNAIFQAAHGQPLPVPSTPTSP
jgi:chitinase